MVVGVEQVVGLLAQRRFQVLAVQRLHVLILVGEADGHVLINAPQHVAAVGGRLFLVVDRLSAAAGAAAGAGHDLHKVVLDVAAAEDAFTSPESP